MIIEINKEDLFGVSSYETYEDGTLKACDLNEENIIKTKYGKFTPKFTEIFGVYERLIKNRSGMTFHKNGEIKSISMEKQCNVYTPFGNFPAELITFYDNGNLNRVFPLNGQINGYWSEEDEGKLAESYHFDFAFGSFSAKIIAIRFYKSGKVRGLTLWPGETIELETPIGKMEVKTGFTLYEDGQLETVEPAKPEKIHTELGSFVSFDADAIGIHGDDNSLAFTQSGSVSRLKSSTHGVAIRDQEGRMIQVGPREVPSYVDISESVIMPMSVTIDRDKVTINNGRIYTFDKSENEFNTYESDLKILSGCTNCSACNACG